MARNKLGPEFQKIEEMTRHLPTASAAVELGIGDDAAILRSPEAKLLFCSDLMIESTHFRRDWATPQEIAAKAVTRAVSDIAAMNGKPLYALVSLALPADTPENYHTELYKGFAKAASEYSVEIVGGDLSHSPSGVIIDVSVVGQTHQPFTRAGARAGDLLIVTGELGGSAAGLKVFEQGLKDDSRWSLLKRLHLLPTARFDVLKRLQDPRLVTSMIDVSDSLGSEIHHLAHQSKVGFEVLQDAIPIHPSAREFSERFNFEALDLALNGGEDYQLLFTVDPDAWEEATASQPEAFETLFHVIGIATPDDQSITLIDSSNNSTPLIAKGWDHFKK